MVAFDLGKPADNANEFLLLRALAINGYANLENSLCLLLSCLLGTDQEATAIIFFQIANTKSRNRIIEQLLKKKFSDTYVAYWFGIPKTPDKRGLMTLINDIDGRRNEIVHWHAVRTLGGTEERATDELSLQRPNFWTSTPTTSDLTTIDLADFLKKVDFVQRSINMFSMLHNPALTHSDDVKATWRDIFQRPCVYPPPSSHPLYMTP